MVDGGKLREFFSEAPDDIALDDVDLARLPAHLSIIMDGNGRWAARRGLDRSQGHAAGVDSLRETITACVRLGVPVLSAYAFSTENWKRPEREVNLLMDLFARTLVAELPLFHQERVRLELWGDLGALPAKTHATFMRGLEETAGYDTMVLALAVNYGSRAELARAARLIARDVALGRLDPKTVDEAAVAERLYTADVPDPELLIRTSGELRLSNYLLWQIAYAELYVTDTLWPDFDRWELLRAIRAFQGRERRFGGVAGA